MSTKYRSRKQDIYFSADSILIEKVLINVKKPLKTLRELASLRENKRYLNEGTRLELDQMNAV